MKVAQMTDVARKSHTRCSGCRDGVAPDLAFAMAFQPIVDISTGRPFAFEALVRGPNGEGALSVLEQITDQNRYVFDQNCRVKAIETAARAGLIETGAKLSINFLPNAVYSPLACIQTTLRTAANFEFPMDRLIFEFTENEKMADPAHVEAIVDTYRRIGFATAIDDFGAGHAGLNLLARLEPDMLKIDMDLVRGIDADWRRRAIVEGIVGLGRALGILVIAEGIETRAEMDTLASAGIRHMQGYLFARPGFQTLPTAFVPA
jgi:EAL domain-containing protein (putative c-di-GMP-specific phosphodiesterase class I)